MNGKSSHTPIYGRKTLLSWSHDREYPDHGADCPCENGLITMLRIYFAPAIPVQNTIKPYVPPDSRPAQTGSKHDPRKPWLKRRPGETQPQYDYRISHSCYNCGTLIVDKQALNLHEDGCSGQGKRTAEVDPDEPE